MNPNIKESIDERLCNLTADPYLAQTVKQAESPPPRRRIRRRVAVVAFTLCLCLFATGALAVTVPDFRKLLGAAGPDVIQMFQPVQLSAQDNGIKMEVLAAINDDEMAAVYLTMQDLNGNRVDEHIDLYDFFIRGTNMSNSQPIDYDPDTKTATIRMLGNGGDQLNGKKTTVEVQSFLSGTNKIAAYDTGLTVADVINANQNPRKRTTASHEVVGGGSNDEFISRLKSNASFATLAPDRSFARTAGH